MCGVVCFPSQLFRSLSRRLGDESRLSVWARAVLDEWQKRVDGGEAVPEGDDFDFWRARYSETFAKPEKPAPGRQVEDADQTEKLLAERRQWVKAGNGSH